MFKVEFDKNYNAKVKFVLKDNLPEELNGLVKNNIFNAKLGEVHNGLNNENEGFIYLGLSNDTLDLEEIKGLGYKLGNLLNSRKLDKVSINLELIKDDARLVKLFYEGLANTQYNFDYYKTKKHTKTLLNVSFNNVDKALINEANNILEGINQARDFVNLTPIDLYPESYASKIQDLFKDTKVKVTVYNKEQIKELGMHAFLTVNHGSDKEPRFVVLEYFNDSSTSEHLTFVGKGVTYDSGGYALKPASSMVGMKNDMGGSATVVGAMHAIQLNDIKTNVVAVTALTENLINGSAYKNGDVINSMKGSTIEVINTDAEGRITLADAIYFAATKLKTTKIIEVSTLTGAIVSALGQNISGITTEDLELYETVHAIGEDVLEFNWRLPMTKQLRSSVKSDIAELKNSVAGGAGAITAGIFLEHFAEGKPFMHIDIAGTAFSARNKYAPNGATGTTVKTLYELAKR